MNQSLMMNDFKLNETYSSLKESYSILKKELSTVKEKNEQLKQRIKELERTNLTKKEMKEMIKEGLTPIVDVLIGKERETVDAETQTDKEEEEKKVQQITGIEEVMKSEKLDSDVYSLTETEDKRIASGSSIDGKISISST